MTTEKQIQSKINLINKFLGANPIPVEHKGGKTKWNVGTYTYEAQGSPCYYTLVRISNEDGEQTSINATCSRGMSAFYDSLCCFIEGITVALDTHNHN